MSLSIYCGGKLLIVPNPRPIDGVMKAIHNERATIFPGVPAMYLGIINPPDVSKASGYKVIPREVEEVLFKNPKVQEAVVAGVPDVYRGETVKAFVVLKAGETATADELTTWCAERLASYKAPKQIEFRSELPKTMMGKVLRRVLVEEEKTKNVKS